MPARNLSARSHRGIDRVDAVGRKALVGGNYRQALAPRLSDQESIEWVAVVQREVCDRQAVIRSEPQDPHSRLDDALVEVIRDGELADRAISIPR